MGTQKIIEKTRAHAAAGGALRTGTRLRAFLEGPNIYLRALEERDLTSDYFQWLQDEEVCRQNSHAVFPNTEKAMVEFLRRAQDTGAAIVLAIISKAEDRHVGNVSLQQIDWIGRNAEFAILIGALEAHGRGVGSEAAELVVRYGFERLNLHRIYCGTFAENLAMRRLAEKLGMKPEGVRRQAAFKSGRYVDVHEYGVLRDEFLGRRG